MGLFTILFYLVLTTMSFMRQAFEQGDGRILLQQRARTALARITPLLVTSIAPNDTTQAVDFPEVVKSFEAPGQSQLRFYSPIDFFGEVQLPKQREAKFYHYEIEFKAQSLFLRDKTRPKLKPRILASQIDSFVVRRVQLNAVNIEVGVSMKNRKEFRLETLVQIPFYAN